jgi:nitroreductase
MTNQTINDILNRRSTRAFTDEKISEETMNKKPREMVSIKRREKTVNIIY